MYGPSPFFCYSSCFLIRLVHANAQLIVGEYLKFYFNCNKIVMLTIGKGQNFHIKKALLWIMKGYIELFFAYLALERHLGNVLSDGNSEHRLKFSYNNVVS